MYTLLVIIVALVLDSMFGEPRRLHPLVGFGNLAGRVEKRIYGDFRLRGVVAALLLLVPATLLTIFAAKLARSQPGGMPWWLVLDILVLYVAVGWRSLRSHADRVNAALVINDMGAARRQVGRMVSRDTGSLDEAGVSRAAVESVLENGNDAMFGALFWYTLAGAPGVVLYRLANTLDAMWGYRNDRYQRFGWAAARLDDLLNIIPARLTALGYAATGRMRSALRCWRRQGGTWKSRNAGVVMAVGAGSLGVRLGGPESYHGAVQERPVLGEGREPTAADINGALVLVRGTLFLWLLVVALAACLVGPLGGLFVERFLAG